MSDGSDPRHVRRYLGIPDEEPRVLQPGDIVNVLGPRQYPAAELLSKLPDGKWSIKLLHPLKWDWDHTYNVGPFKAGEQEIVVPAWCLGYLEPRYHANVRRVDAEVHG